MGIYFRPIGKGLRRSGTGATITMVMARVIAAVTMIVVLLVPLMMMTIIIAVVMPVPVPALASYARHRCSSCAPAGGLKRRPRL